VPRQKVDYRIQPGLPERFAAKNRSKNRLAVVGPRDYRNHIMKTRELTVTRVGNSRGVRLPAEVLRRYQIGDTLIMEQRPDEIVLRPKRTRQQKLTWAETYQQMAECDEDWSDWESLPGETGK
jgi:antitoxin component of MazEF toxin-antitoxin module